MKSASTSNDAAQQRQLLSVIGRVTFPAGLLLGIANVHLEAWPPAIALFGLGLVCSGEPCQGFNLQFLTSVPGEVMSELKIEALARTPSTAVELVPSSGLAARTLQYPPTFPSGERLRLRRRNAT
jgi:hypothetical protein